MSRDAAVSKGKILEVKPGEDLGVIVEGKLGYRLLWKKRLAASFEPPELFKDIVEAKNGKSLLQGKNFFMST
jgi:hypothetical protein